MARGRLISKSLGSSRRFHAVLHAGGRVGEFCQVLFPLIVANTDDYGRMPGDAFTVKHLVLPTSKRPERDFDAALNALAAVHLVARYVVEGVAYLEVQQFDKHQPNLHKRTKSLFPESPGDSGISGNVPELPAQSNLTEPKTTEPNPEGNPEPRAVPRTCEQRFEVLWQAYPKKRSKDAARRAWDKRRPDEALLALMLAALAWQTRHRDWTKEQGKFIPYPATWLNAAGWLNEPTAAPPQAGPYTCPHTPKCDNPNWRCRQRTDMENFKAKVPA